MPSSACQKCARSEEHTSELQSHSHLVCRLLLEKKKTQMRLKTENMDHTNHGRSCDMAPQHTTRNSTHSSPPRSPSPPSALINFLFFFFRTAPPPEISPLPPPAPFPI